MVKLQTLQDVPTKVDAKSIVNNNGVLKVSNSFIREMSNFVSVKDFGAKGDGVTDDTTAIQAALNSLIDLGGIVDLPTGKYKITSSITVPQGVTLRGSGRSNATSADYSTRVSPNFDGDVFILGGAWSRVESFTITHSGTPTSGNAIYAEDVADPSAENIYIVNTFNGVNFVACNTPLLDNVHCVNLKGAYGFKTEGNSVLGNSDSHLFRNISGGFLGTGPSGYKHLIHGNYTNSGKTIGYRFVKGDFGVVCEGTTDDADDIWFIGGGCDNQVDDAFRFTSGQNIFITDAWAGQAGQYGVILNTDFTGNLTAKGLRIRGAGNRGFYALGGSNIHLSESLIGQNGTDASNTYAGVELKDVDTVTISGGTYGTLAAGGSNQQKYGILCSGSTDNVMISGANLIGNLTANFASSASGNEIYVVNCLGYKTEAYGTKSAAFSSNVFSFAHGLNTTPEYVNASIISSSENDRFIVDTSGDATNINISIFDISSNNLISSGTHSISWIAKARN